jgi:hypothetical protein
VQKLADKCFSSKTSCKKRENICRQVFVTGRKAENFCRLWPEYEKWVGTGGGRTRAFIFRHQAFDAGFIPRIFDKKNPRRRDVRIVTTRVCIKYLQIEYFLFQYNLLRPAGIASYYQRSLGEVAEVEGCFIKSGQQRLRRDIFTTGAKRLYTCAMN